MTEGTRVLVPFGKRKMTGVVMGKADHSEISPDRLQTVIEVLDQGVPLLDEQLTGLLRWCWKYYK
ncbi:MAG: hypothetical protein EX260_10685, partial [Desulfobulbaceae bacterium]